MRYVKHPLFGYRIVTRVPKRPEGYVEITEQEYLDYINKKNQEKAKQKEENSNE